MLVVKTAQQFTSIRTLLMLCDKSLFGMAMPHLIGCERQAGGLLAFGGRFLLGHARRPTAAARSGRQNGATSPAWSHWPAEALKRVGEGAPSREMCAAAMVLNANF